MKRFSSHRLNSWAQMTHFLICIEAQSISKPSLNKLIMTCFAPLQFKARVSMEGISGRKTIQEIASDLAIHPIQVKR